MIKALVLDFGGVLFPVQPYLVKPEEAKFREIKQLVIDIYNKNEHLINSKTYTKELFLKQLREKGAEIFSDQEINLIGQSILDINPDILAMIKEVHSKYCLYALVNEAPKWTELRIYFHNLDKYFKDFFISSYVGYKKPDPKFFQEFLKCSGFQASECIFVDDKEENMTTARALGFVTFRSGIGIGSRSGITRFFSQKQDV